MLPLLQRWHIKISERWGVFKAGTEHYRLTPSKTPPLCEICANGGSGGLHGIWVVESRTSDQRVICSSPCETHCFCCTLYASEMFQLNKWQCTVETRWAVNCKSFWINWSVVSMTVLIVMEGVVGNLGGPLVWCPLGSWQSGHGRLFVFQSPWGGRQHAPVPLDMPHSSGKRPQHTRTRTHFLGFAWAVELGVRVRNLPLKQPACFLFIWPWSWEVL